MNNNSKIIVIPEGIRKIKDFEFSGNNLTNVTLPKTLKK